MGHSLHSEIVKFGAARGVFEVPLGFIWCLPVDSKLEEQTANADI